jgi:hypothetical protein
VEIGLDVGASPTALAPVAGSDVGLHANDRFEPCLPGLILKLPGCVEIAVIRDGQRRLFEFEGAADQVIYAVRPVEKGVLAVAV